jgi:hypothetical protein
MVMINPRSDCLLLIPQSPEQHIYYIAKQIRGRGRGREDMSTSDVRRGGSVAKP